MGMFGNSQHPRPGASTGPGGIDRMGVTRGNPIPPQIKFFKGNVPSENPFNINNTPHTVPGYQGNNADPYAAIQQYLGGNIQKSAFNVTNMSRVNIPIHVIPMHNKMWGDVHLKEQEIMWTRYHDSIPAGDEVKKHRLNVFTLQELNAHLDEHADIYQTPGDVVDKFGVLGVLQTQRHTLSSTEKGQDDMNTLAVLNKGIMHVFNHAGNNVRNGDHIFVVYKIMPQTAENYNFTLISGNVSKQASKYRTTPKTLDDFYKHRERMYAHDELDAIQEQERNVDAILRQDPFGEKTYRKDGFTKTRDGDWTLAPGYAMQARIVFSSRSEPTYDSLIYSAEVVEKNANLTSKPNTRRIMGLGAYQRIGTVKHIRDGQKTRHQSLIDRANFDKYTASQLGWFEMMVCVQPPVIPESYTTHVTLGDEDYKGNV